ncbi:hypothetical protein [Exiguobacterium aurantiacum]|uniref:hypothetical protein n=1 Tax=Exiguobacterium aurantiacum TaxID=33987 RepID=UPI00384F093C
MELTYEELDEILNQTTSDGYRWGKNNNVYYLLTGEDEEHLHVEEFTSLSELREFVDFLSR